MGRFKVGDLVTIKATVFDIPETPRWSEAHYGNKWRTARVLGRIMSIAIDNPGPNMWRMTWDDKTESEHSSSSLRRPSPAELEADVTGDDDFDEEDISG